MPTQTNFLLAIEASDSDSTKAVTAFNAALAPLKAAAYNNAITIYNYSMVVKAGTTSVYTCTAIVGYITVSE